MDSFWRDILAAMCQAISFTKAVWVEYPNSVFDPSTGFQFADASEYDPAAHATLKDLDRLFLRQLGINIDQPGALPAESPQPITLIQQMAYDPWKPGNPAPPIKPPLDTVTQNSLFYYTLRADRLPENIYSLAKGTKLDGTRPDGSTDPSSERAKCMERVLNDFRVSFLGSSPRYTDFRPLDFDGDGKVMCSVYDQSPAASATENNNKTNRYASVVDATTGVGPAPARLFSASGNFFLGKSRFYRILTRGELYDNLLEKPVSQRLLETVVVVDPEGPLQTPFQASNVKLKGTRILYQSWIYDDSTSELPRQLR
jgi:hypothetical protein